MVRQYFSRSSARGCYSLGRNIRLYDCCFFCGNADAQRSRRAMVVRFDVVLASRQVNRLDVLGY
jgi:hypothetical protein